MRLKSGRTPEGEIKAIAYFGQLEKEHFKECVASGFMTEEERSEEMKRLRDLCSSSIAKILDMKNQCAR